MSSRPTRGISGGIEYGRRGEGTPVLVVHGSPGGCDQGLVLADFLLRGGDFEVIAPSRPGYLGSPLAAGSTIDEQADLLAALLGELGVERARVLAWSGGGPASLRLAVRHPELVERIALLSAVAGRYEMYELSTSGRWLISSRAGLRLLDAMLRRLPRQAVGALLAEEGDLSKEELRRQVGHAVCHPEQLRFLRAVTQTATLRPERREGFENDKRRFAAIETLELDRVGCPTLLVHGTADTDVSPEQSRLAHAELPASELHEIEAGTHFCAWAHPDSEAAQRRVIEHLR